MSKVKFIYGKGGREVLMARRYAETLRKLGHGTYADDRQPQTDAPPAIDEPLVSEALATFASENNVDLSKVVGTGKDGRIKKSDIEAFIAVQV